jgi:hypothetical protein
MKLLTLRKNNAGQEVPLFWNARLMVKPESLDQAG